MIRFVEVIYCQVVMENIFLFFFWKFIFEFVQKVICLVQFLIGECKYKNIVIGKFGKLFIFEQDILFQGNFVKFQSFGDELLLFLVELLNIVIDCKQVNVMYFMRRELLLVLFDQFFKSVEFFFIDRFYIGQQVVNLMINSNCRCIFYW